MNRFVDLTLNLLKHELITGSFYIFIGGLFSNFIAFLFNLFMARSLSYSDYGILASLVSLFALAVIPSQSLVSTTVRFATNFFAREENELASVFYKKMLLFWFIFGIFLFIAIFLLSSAISSFLNISNNFLVIVTGVSIALTYMAIVNMSFLQSLLKFRYLAFLYSASAITKIFLGVLFILLGFSVGGALWAIASMTLVIYVLGFFPLKDLLKKGGAKDVSIDWGEIVRFAFPTMLVILSITSLVTTDVILVKHFFSSSEAGLYGGVSLIGKVIFYFTAPIPSVMFPLLVKKHTKGEDFRGLFYLAIILVIIPSVLITLIYFVFPQFSIKFFLGGGDYFKIISFLGIFGILISIFSVLNVVVNFFLSIKRTEIAIPCVLAAVFQIILISLFHASFYQIIYISTVISALLLAFLLLYYIRQYGLYYTSK